MTEPWVRREVIGDAVLYQGDCLAVLPTLEAVDAVVTDPPYGNSNHDGDWSARLNEHRGLANKPIANDDEEGMRRVVDGVLLAIVPILSKTASACCCFCGGGGGRDQFLLGLLKEWIKQACSFFIRLSGTNETPA